MKKPERYGDILFGDIKTIRHSRFSHYLIENEQILELNSMRAIYEGFKEINDMLDEHHWGLLYPVFKIYKELRYRYRKFNQKRKHQNLKRLRAAATAQTPVQ